MLATGLSMHAGVTYASSAVTLSAINGTPGQTITVTGSGFGNNALNIYWDSVSSPTLKSIWVNGAFSTTITIPQATGGSHLILAKDAASNQAQAPFTVTPLVTLQKASGVQNSSNVVMAQGYASGETVNLYWTAVGGSPSSTPNWSGTANSRGTATINMTVPVAPTGTYIITVIGATSNEQASSSFGLIPALSVTPGSGGPGSTVSVSGTGFNPGQTVSIYWNCSAAPCSGTRLATSGTTDTNGNFTAISGVVLPIPASPGTYMIGGQDSAASSSFSSVSFTVQAPRVSLSPTSGPAGTATTVSGSGFQAGETVNIYWNCSVAPCSGTPLASPIASSTGTVSTNVTIPTGMSTGSYPIAGQGASSSLFAMATFTAQAILNLSPTKGGSGTNVTVVGKGYNPNENVALYWNCSASPCGTTLLATQQADASGTLTMTVTIPAIPYGIYPITGVGDQGNSVSVRFRVVAAVSITAVNLPVDLYGVEGVQPGQPAIVSGVSYAPGETVDVSWCGRTCTMLTTAMADSHGSFNVTVTVPSNIPNAPYTVSVVGETSLLTATTSITVLPIATMTPSSGRVGSSVTISGQGFGSNHWVQIVWNCPIAISCSATGTIWINTTSDANGSFTFTGAIIPPNSLITATPSPGQYWIRVKDHTFPFQTETWTTFTVQQG